jgi:hypothetical protein
MPESKDISTKKNAVAKKEQTAKREPRPAEAPNAVGFKPVMFGFMLLGLVWIVTYYVTSSTLSLPVPALGQNNIFVGFGIMFIGFLMTTRWR